MKCWKGKKRLSNDAPISLNRMNSEPQIVKTTDEIAKEMLLYAKVTRISYLEPEKVKELFAWKEEIHTEEGGQMELDIVGIPSSFFKSKLKFFDANIKNISDAQVYSFVNKEEELVITIRGTSSIADMKADLKIKKKPFFDIIYNQYFGLDRKHIPFVHDGFLNQYNSLRFHLHYIFSRYQKKLPIGKIPRVIFASHSLGAAVSTLSALVMKSLFPQYDIWNYTYGSPRVGDPFFAYVYDQILGKTTYRIKNQLDPIAYIPHWNYEHVGRKVSFKDRMEILPLLCSKKRKRNWIGKCVHCVGNYGNLFSKRKKAHTLEEYIFFLESYIPCTN